MTSLTDASQTRIAAATAGRPIEQAVQDIAGLASLACETPFAVLNLRGFDVAWFGSGRRIDDDACPQHNPCDEYAIQCTDLFEVLDAALDERFAATMPLIDGHTVRFYAGVPILGADGSAAGTLAVLDTVPRGLTARQRAALSLLARHATSQLALYEELIVAQARVESAPVAIYQTDEHGLVTYANPEYRRFFSLGPTESLDNWANGVHADDRSRMEAAWVTFCTHPQAAAFEYRTVPRGGASRVLCEQVVAARGTLGFIGTISDITERIESHANLQRAETLFQNTFEQAPISIVYADRDGRVLRSNQTFCKLLGFNSRQIEMMSIAELTHDADVTHNAAEFARLWNGAIYVIDVETRYLCMDRRAVWVRVTTALLRDASGAPTCAVEFIRDISARKDLAAALLENQRLLEAVIADIPFAIRACDVEGRVFLHNPAAAEFYAIGTTDESASNVEIFLSDGKTPVPIEQRPMARALRGETVTDMDLVVARSGELARATRSSARRLSGQNGECLGAVAVTQDITQEQKLERELAQAHKLESIGQLAAGIAHEINTPTQFVGDNIRFLRDSFQDILRLVAELKALIAAATGGAAVAMAPIAAALDGPDVTYLQDEIPKAISQSLEGVERIAKIVGAMKEFSHPSTERTPLDLNRAIASTITVASNEWKYVADIKTEFDSQLPPVPVMPGSFNQVILNMIVNAAHAISAAAPDATSAKGTITITTRGVDDWVEIGITDTGCGIPASTIPRIFDQFFTTKPVGKGTGQGLAIAHDVVVTKHGGTITVESEPGVGTTFTLRLPMKGETAPRAEAA